MNADKQTSAPSRHVVAGYTFVVLLPLVYFIPPWLMRYVTDDPLIVTVLALAIIVPIVTYVALPILFKSYDVTVDE